MRLQLKFFRVIFALFKILIVVIVFVVVFKQESFQKLKEEKSEGHKSSKSDTDINNSEISIKDIFARRKKIAQRACQGKL